MPMDAVIWVMYFFSIYFAVFWMLVILDNRVVDGKKFKKLKKFPVVTVTIPAYNEEKSIVETIKSVVGLDYPREKLQIIVVDDCSSDSTGKLVKEFINSEKNYYGKIDIKYIKHEVNKGKGVAMNTALTVADGEFFVCLDADSFVERNALMNMIPHFEEVNVASVLPLIKLKKIKGFALNLQYVEYLVNFFLKKVMGFLDCIHVTPGPFGVYRKKALESVGGFDEGNLTEDLEMALRLQKRNYKIIQLVGTKVHTLAPSNIRGWFKQRNRWYKGTLINLNKYRSMFFNKKYGVFGTFQLPMVFCAAMLSIFFAVFVGWKHILRPLLHKIYDFSYINFDVGLMGKLWFERFHFLDISYMIIFFTLIIFSFALAWIAYSFKSTGEKFTKRGFLSTSLFVVIYPFFLSLVWIGVVFDLARGKKQNW